MPPLDHYFILYFGIDEKKPHTIKDNSKTPPQYQKTLSLETMY
jgi:hypothetical protein